ncbi:hypothetical protein [Brevibacillus dissolubilis]|uniref:hypothetical protein n=1 Tax=Brevibacillus dissolubilis TaxID=1844116 RepID=UPI001116420D|nr:hypothetical protein [Brevibacillus dissolubilis]
MTLLNNDWQDMFEEVKQWHQKGIEGDKEAVKQASSLMAKIRLKVFNNTLVDAYHGSIQALQARDLISPMDRLDKANKGLKALDRAVAKEPDNQEIRFLRGNVAFNLPEMYFHRNKTAVEDFEFLIALYEKDSKAFAKETYWKLLYKLGAAYKNLEKETEAKAAWQKLLSKTTDTGYRKLLQDEGIF